MYTIPAVLTTLLALSSALENPHNKVPKRPKFQPPKEAFERASSNHGQKQYLTSKTKKFAVNGNAIPDVPFDIGESYAGVLPIASNGSAFPTSYSNSSYANHTAPDESGLFFWFFPSTNVNASKEITIWLNGGPGCSSMLGLLQENGPFLWQPGTYRPYANPYSWVNLTNMVWVDQPIGTGFSPAAPGAAGKLRNEVDIAQSFMGFWKNFMDTFDITGRKVYITGESYAGQYIPYIAYEMLITNNTQYYNVAGIQINDPSINSDAVMTNAPAVGMVNALSPIFGLNDSTMNYLNTMNKKCGFYDFMEEALTYPPKGILPGAPEPTGYDCDLWGWASNAAIQINPCFNFYHVTDFCPYLWDVFGFPSLGWGPSGYFNRSDVQEAIHAPPTNYFSCGDHQLGIIQHGDPSPPSALGPLPKVIEMTNNVLIGGGEYDFLLITNGTLATIQNMTWNGKQGFQTKPSAQFYVPYHSGLSNLIGDIFYQPIPGPIITNFAGAGYLGTTHSERGLTFCSVEHSGHEIPEYMPGAAYRMLEFLLGRIPSLETISDFTTQTGNYYSGTENFKASPSGIPPPGLGQPPSNSSVRKRDFREVVEKVREEW